MSETAVETPTNGVENNKDTSIDVKSNTSGEVSKETEAPPSRRSKRIRSRSKTPQLKNGVENNDNKEKLSATPEKNGEASSEKQQEDKKEEETIDLTENDSQESQEVTTEEYVETDMEPLVLQSDEPSSELEFEESDLDSGKYSPVISRCATRRSQNRNIPTPKTPKIDESEEPALNETDNNFSNYSTKAQLGSGSELDCSELDGESDFLVALKHKNGRNITSRKSIREDIRKKSLRNSMMMRANLSIPFFSSSRDSVERAPSVKRKSRSETPEDRKRFKSESPGFYARFTSPLTSLRSRFVTEDASTPKLTSYRDGNNHLGGDLYDQMPLGEGEAKPENKWCSIM